MPQIVIGAVLLGAAAGATTAATALSLALAGASMIVGGMLSLATGKPDIAQPTDMDTSRGQLANTQTSQAAIAAIYGRTRVGINRAYVQTTGTNLENLHIIALLGEGPCSGIYNNEVFLGDDLISTYGADASYVFHNGASDQSYDSTLHGFDSEWIDSLRNTAYLYLKFIFNRDKFASFPEMTATVNGRLLYDPRDTSTAWSDNPALVIRDLMTNAFYGLGWSTDYLDADSFGIAATWCEDNGYTFNGCLSTREAAFDTIAACLKNFRGAIIWSGGKWRLIILDYDATVMTLTEDDILGETSQTSFPSVQSTINTARIKFHNSEDGYTLQDLLVVDDAAIVTDGEPREEEIYLNGSVTHSQSQKIGTYEVDRARVNGEYSFICRPRALALEPGDMIKVTRSLFGWTEQVCRVLEVAPLANFTVALKLCKEFATIYDDSINVTSHTQYTTNLPNPLAVPPSVININWTEESYVLGDNTYSRIFMNFDPPANYPFFKHAEAWISWDEGVSWKFLGKNSAAFTVETLREGQDFQLKLLSVSTYEIGQEIGDVSSVGVTVTGLSAAPENVSDFKIIPAGDSMNMKWSAVSDNDVLWFEIRTGAAWGTSLLVARTRSQSLSIPTVRPDTHIFMIKVKNNAGLYSETPGIDTRTTYAPVGYSQSVGSPYNEDYDSGTHYNTFYEDDPSYGRLLKVKASSLNNPGFESWSTPTQPTNWTVYISGESRIKQETGIIYEGSNSCCLEIDVGNSGAAIYQSQHLRDSALSLFRFRHYSASGETLKYNIYSNTDGKYLTNDGLWSGEANWFIVANSSGEWGLEEKTFTTDSTGDYRVYIRNNEAAQVGVSGEIYIDATKLWSSKGFYQSPVTDISAVVRRRLWASELILHYYGIGTTWESIFGSGELWTDKLAEGDSWAVLFGGANCGDLAIDLFYSEDNISYDYFTNFQLYQGEAHLRYFYTGYTITNVSEDNFVSVEDMNVRVYQLT